MQTFLPHPSFDRSAQCLDRQRLGKQRIEVVQMLRALAGETMGYVRHPITQGWKGYEHALIGYGLAVCDEWVRRGYVDNQRSVIDSFTAKFTPSDLPPWWDCSALFACYRGLLKWKDPAFYGSFAWEEDAVDWRPTIYAIMRQGA